MIFVSVHVQDVDSAYLVKADLEDKVGALTDEINFLRHVYDEVQKRPHVSSISLPVLPHFQGIQKTLQLILYCAKIHDYIW